jgi:isopenicillin N synthase-like dioxygenase
MAYATVKQVDSSLIPVIDLSELGTGTPAVLQRIADDISQAAETSGFFYVKNHGIPAELIDNVYRLAGEFFRRPIDEKNQVKVNSNHRGFLSTGGAKMSDDAKPDLKESYIWGLDVDDQDPDYLAGRALVGPNQWPESLPEMCDVMVTYFEAANNLAWNLFKVFATALDLPADHFIKTVDKPMTRCSIIYYPPQEIDAGADQFGVAPHTDFGALTLLRQDEVGGLQVQDKNGDWVTATPIEGTLVVNVADLLSRWTNNRFASTPHRVVNTSGRERFSIVAAVDPNYDTDMTPIVREGESPLFEPTTCGEYLVWRFAQAFKYRNKT